MATAYKQAPALSRYIGRTFLLRIAVVLLGLLVVLQIMDVIGESNRILAVTGAGESDLWRYAALRLPILLGEFLPFAVLLATLITFATLAASSQVVIMRSLGLSPHQILIPMLSVAAGCATFHLAWNETIGVRSAVELATWQATGYGAHPVDDAAVPGESWTMVGDTVIRARPIAADEKGTTFADVAIFKHVRNGGLGTVTLADRGLLDGKGHGTLENVREVDLASRDVNVSAAVPWQPGVTPEHFTTHAQNPERMNVFELAAAAQALRGSAREDSELQAELYHRLARPLASLLMPLLGAVVAFGLARAGNVLARAGIGLGLGFTYFMVDGVIMAMGRSGAIPPPIAAWMPVLIFLIVSEAILFRTEQ